MLCNAEGKRILSQFAIGGEMKLELIRLTQSGLPVILRPFKKIADDLQVSETNVINEFQSMIESGQVRRIAAIPNHYRMGYLFNGMTVWDIDDQFVDALGAQVGNLIEVSHCYRRPRHPGIWNYNLFAMVHGKTKDECLQSAQKIESIVRNHCRGHEILFSKRILKKTGLRLNP